MNKDTIIYTYMYGGSVHELCEIIANPVITLGEHIMETINTDMDKLGMSQNVVDKFFRSGFIYSMYSYHVHPTHDMARFVHHFFSISRKQYGYKDDLLFRVQNSDTLLDMYWFKSSRHIHFVSPHPPMENFTEAVESYVFESLL